MDDYQKPQLLDVAAKEILFADQILFLEGQEDVGLIRNWLSEKGLGDSFSIFDYLPPALVHEVFVQKIISAAMDVRNQVCKLQEFWHRCRSAAFEEKSSAVHAQIRHRGMSSAEALDLLFGRKDISDYVKLGLVRSGYEYSGLLISIDQSCDALESELSQTRPLLAHDFTPDFIRRPFSECEPFLEMGRKAVETAPDNARRNCKGDLIVGGLGGDISAFESLVGRAK